MAILETESDARLSTDLLAWVSEYRYVRLKDFSAAAEAWHESLSFGMFVLR
jgi:hypothetical protein